MRISVNLATRPFVELRPFFARLRIIMVLLVLVAIGLGVALHFQRIVGAHVGSAFGAGQFYTQKVSDARDQTSKLANDHRDEDREGPAGFDSKAQRARDFAAEMALQAFALLAAAEGMVDGYKQVTGEEWKPYVAPADNNKKVDRQSADAELSAFGG